MNTEMKIETGRIGSIQKNTFIINYNEEEISAKLKGSFLYDNAAEWPVVGDYVNFVYNTTGDSLITEIVNRKNILKRPDQSGHAMPYVKNMQTQDMVANIDYIFIVTSLNADYSFNRVARYVSYALEADAVPVVILTKMDLCNSPGRYISEIETLSEKVHVHAVSAIYNMGIDELQEYLQPGKTILLLGSSGAGKSTLVNVIAQKDVMKTSEIRESDSKGRHTTTYRQLIKLDNGVTVIDTPGMREIGLMDVDNGIDDTFSDIVSLAQMCRFTDCKHEKEPGCAIRKAIENGELSEERFELFRGLSRENRNNAALKKQIAIWKKQRSKF